MKKPVVAMIAAISENKVLGMGGKIPWSIPTDVQRFRDKTKGHVVIMGRKTYESIGHALPQRTNVIVTHDPQQFLFSHPEFDREAHILAPTIEEAIENGKELENSELFIIGGGQIYEAAMPYADKLYLTLVKGKYAGDAFFPAYEREFTKETFRQDGEENGHQYTFLDLERE